MKNRLYAVSILYFLSFMFAVLASGGWLFLVGLGVDDWRDVHHILTEQSVKSIEGIIEIATPHIFGMGLLLFVLVHFLLLSDKTEIKSVMLLFYIVFLMILLNQSSYLFISMGLEIFGWIKPVVVFLSMALFVALGMMLVRLLRGSH